MWPLKAPRSLSDFGRRWPSGAAWVGIRATPLLHLRSICLLWLHPKSHPYLPLDRIVGDQACDRFCSDSNSDQTIPYRAQSITAGQDPHLGVNQSKCIHMKMATTATWGSPMPNRLQVQFFAVREICTRTLSLTYVILIGLAEACQIDKQPFMVEWFNFCRLTPTDT